MFGTESRFGRINSPIGSLIKDRFGNAVNARLTMWLVVIYSIIALNCKIAQISCEMCENTSLSRHPSASLSTQAFEASPSSVSAAPLLESLLQVGSEESKDLQITQSDKPPSEIKQEGLRILVH